MLTVTDKASEVIKEFLKDKKENSTIRITMAESCCGTSLGMALDEAKSEDKVFDEKGTKFVIDKDLLSQVQPITVDFIETPSGSGFKLSSSLAEPAGGCGSSCGSGSSCGC
jgi:iron-sulfur cluster assembly protein